jgi:rhamnose transport system substrate-binding protein
MLDGTIQVFYLWDPIKLGYVTYYAAKLLSEGKLKGEAGGKFTIPEGRKWPGTYTIIPDLGAQIVTGGPLEYTKANYKDHNY